MSLGVRLAEWSKCMPSNHASAGASPTSCKYSTGYNLIPSGKGDGKPLLWKISPGKLQWKGYSTVNADALSMALEDRDEEAN